MKKYQDNAEITEFLKFVPAGIWFNGGTKVTMGCLFRAFAGMMGSHFAKMEQKTPPVEAKQEPLLTKTAGTRFNRFGNDCWD